MWPVILQLGCPQDYLGCPSLIIDHSYKINNNNKFNLIFDMLEKIKI